MLQGLDENGQASEREELDLLAKAEIKSKSLPGASSPPGNVLNHKLELTDDE